MQTLAHLSCRRIALLVWGTHIVRSGVLRVLRRQPAAGAGDQRVAIRLTAFLAGLGVTGLVQSSSATALITGSFVNQNLMALAPALAIMLGADVGTSLVVQLFSLDLSWLSPLLIGFGVLFHLSRKATRAGQIGRIAIGLGLIILALQMILQAAAAVHQARRVCKVIFGSLSGDPLLDMLIGARLHRAGVVEPRGRAAHGRFAAQRPHQRCRSACSWCSAPTSAAASSRVLATAGAGPAGRRVALGNLLFKLAGCVPASRCCRGSKPGCRRSTPTRSAWW